MRACRLPGRWVEQVQWLDHGRWKDGFMMAFWKELRGLHRPRRHPSRGQGKPCSHASVPSWKFVDEIKMSKSASGKAQTTAIAEAIARNCNAAWRRFSASL